MKSSLKFTHSLIVLAILAVPGVADPVPQTQLRFNAAAPGTWAADWTGVDGRTYFSQWSTDMVNWYYAPFIDFGEGEHSRGTASTSPKYFIRLRHGDFPGITNLEEAQNADFDGDGLSNIFEVTFGYNPYNANSTVDGADNAIDPDGDGMSNATENTKSLNPMRKDNPKLLLQVMVE